MPAKSIKLDFLELDLENPRIIVATDQRDAMQKIINEQKVKLINLAESISIRGFSPIDRCLVTQSPIRKGRFIVLEGNRRILAAKLLTNPSLMNDLDMPESHKKRLEKASLSLNISQINPVDCFVVQDRSESKEWIKRRHNGEDDGRGIVSWSAIAVARFNGRDAALQALDFVIAHAELTEEQGNLLAGKFPLTTLDRLLSTPDVRRAIGFELTMNKLQTELPASEALKPLRRIVLDLAQKKKTVTHLKSRDQMVDYITKELSPVDRPDFAQKTGKLLSIENFSEEDFEIDKTLKTKKSSTPRLAARVSIVPKSCKLNIQNAKIEKIYNELKILQLSKHVHAISVLLRVFLEMSVDDYMEKTGISLTVKKNGHTIDKKLAMKVEEVVNDLANKGNNKKDFRGVTASFRDNNHPFSIDTLHAYIHNRFFTPTEQNLVTGWDNSQRFFETIWR